MKKAAITVAVVSLALAGSVFAADAGKSQNFDQRKAEILKKIDERIREMQDDKSCVQGARDQDSLKACKEKRQKMLERDKKEKTQ